MSLNGKYWATKRKRWDDPEERTRAMEIVKGQVAKDAGVTHLEGVMHEFKPKNGAMLRIYSSPF